MFLSTPYTYDSRGNMITSTLNDLTIQYNPINLPGVLSSDFGSQTTYYSTGGSKIMTVNEYDDPSTGYPSELTRLYFMGMELEYEGVGNFSSTFTPKAYNFGDGRLLFDGSDTRKQYHLHDHLGNVVVVFEDKNNDGFIEETDNPNTNEVLHRYHYYSRRDFCASKEEPLARPNPAGERDTFGMLWDLPDPLTPLYSDDNRYQYNGKEFEQVANLLDYGWRWYDPVIGRWGGVDPLAEHPNQIHISPFAYAWNNPILLIDPDGLCPDCGDNVLRLYAYPYQQVGRYIASGASYVGNSIKSGFNYLSNMVSPGSPQQHTGENWHLFGDGSLSGSEINAPHANPDGENKSIDISGMFPSGGGVNELSGGRLNIIRALDGFNNDVNKLSEQLSLGGKSNEPTINSELKGNRTEVAPGTRIEPTPPFGGIDTIPTNEGRMERRRDPESGILFLKNIDID